MLTPEQGSIAVNNARSAIAAKLGIGPEPRPLEGKPFDKPSGVFVTLRRGEQLRGCIGHPYPEMKLQDAIPDAAISAAFGDPRFPRLSADELEDVTVEVTVLTHPRLLDCPPEKRADCVEVGRHGLIASMGGRRGLLLPQVPIEQGWDAREFLSQTCWKAGIDTSLWDSPDVEFQAFEGQVFSETSPGGEIREIKLN